jgi:anti-anti-sigma regulatory factor
MTIEAPSPLREPVLDVEVQGDLATRRRTAVAEAVADAATRCGRPTRPAAAGLRRYGPGCLVLALAGRFDRPAVERLRALGPEIERRATTELVVDLSQLERCDALLARAVARIRIRCLANEARVELHDPPPALAAELGQLRL